MGKINCPYVSELSIFGSSDQFILLVYFDMCFHVVFHFAKNFIPHGHHSTLLSNEERNVVTRWNRFCIIESEPEPIPAGHYRGYQIGLSLVLLE
jgi:hypothetical protein